MTFAKNNIHVSLSWRFFMTVRINNERDMHPDIQLSEVVNQPNILQSRTQTLGGMVTQSGQKTAGQIYELRADLRGNGLYGYFTRADAAYFAALRDNITVFQVVHPSRTLAAVMVPADGINLQVVDGDETVEQEDTERMYGSIQIIKVG
jgi:hypothetical protein